MRMRYRVAPFWQRPHSLGTTYPAAEAPRVDQIWISLGFSPYPGDGAPHVAKWRTCRDAMEALAPAYEANTPQGLAAIACINQLLTAMGRGSETIEIVQPDPPPGTCSVQGVRMTDAQGGYTPFNCPTGPNCFSTIDAETGNVIVRDVIGQATPSAVCSRWGFRYGEPAGGWPTGGGGTTEGTPGGGVTTGTPKTGQPGSGIYVPINLPGGQQQQGQGTQGGPLQSEIIPEKKTVDKNGLVGAGIGILAVIGAAIYGSQK